MINIKMTPWIQTYTDIKFDPYNIQPEDISILDIAHSLAHTCRWGGHCRTFYSVAQHSVIVMEQVSAENKLVALLHDAAEAYIGDMPSPIKATLPDYRYLEGLIMESILAKFGLPSEIPDEVHEADKLLGAWEAHELLYDKDIVESWAGPHPMDGEHLRIWGADTAEHTFLYEFDKLTGREDAATY